MNGIQQPGRLREEHLFQLRGGRDPVPGAHHHGGRVQIVEAELGQRGRHRLHDAAPLDGIRDEQHLARLADRLHQQPVVQGIGGAQVDDLGGQIEVIPQLVSGGDRRVERRPEGDHGQVGAGALDRGEPELDLVVGLGHTGSLERLADVVELLALEEEHGIGAGKRGVHHPLGVIRRDRVDHLEAGDVIGERREVLRVLGTVFGADGDAHHHRQGQHSRGHRLPLRQLVEELVAGPAHEVGVHQLRDRPASLHAVAHGRADDTGFGDRRVEQPVVREGFRQTAVHREGAAPIPVLLAERDHGRVDGEAVEERLEDGVSDIEDLHLGHRLAILEGGADLALDLFDTGVVGEVLEQLRRTIIEPLDVPVGVHHLADQLRVEGQARRCFQVGGEPEHGEHRLLDLELSPVQGIGADRTGLHQALPVSADRVRRLPMLDLLLGAIARGIGRRMTAEAIGDGIEEHRALPPQQDLLLALEGVDHRQGVIAVDPFGVHLLRVHAGANPSDELAGHGLPVGLAPHSVEVVHAVEDDRKTSAQRLIPELAVLVHAREGDPLPHRAAAEGGVADVGHHDAGPPIHPLVEGGSGGDRSGASDDGVVRVDAKGREEGMHRSAQPAVEAGLTGEDLAVGAVDEEPCCQIAHRSTESPLHRTEHSAVSVGAHDLKELWLAQLPDRREGLGQNLPMAPVGPEDVVVGGQREGHPHGGRLLTDGEMGGTSVVIGDAAVGALELDLVEDGLEFPDGAHISPYVQEVLGRVARLLFLHRLLVSVDRDGAEADDILRQRLLRFDGQQLGHGRILLTNLEDGFPQRFGHRGVREDDLGSLPGSER